MFYYKIALCRKADAPFTPPKIAHLFPFLSFVLLPALLPAQNRMPDSIALRTVVIQATRADAKSPVPHTNISAEKIAGMYQVQDVPFLLSGVPSLVETSDAGAGVGYSGLRIRGSDPTRVNVTINGVPLNDAESQGMYWVDLPDLAASAAEIQVQRGVGMSTNGAGAFGATVNLDLSHVDPEPFANITNSFGSFATRKHSAQLGTGLMAGKVAFNGRFSTIRSDGYIDRAGADLNALHLSGVYIDDRQSLQAHVLRGHEITYQAWNGVPAQYVDDPQLRTFNTAGTERPGEPYPDEVDNYTQNHFLLHYKRIFRHGLHLQLNGHYTRGYGFYENYKAGEAYADYGLPDWQVGDTTIAKTDLVRRKWLDNHFYGATFALRWQPPVNFPGMSGAPVFTLGGALHRYSGRHFGEIIWTEFFAGIPGDFRYYNNDALKRDANLFAKLEVSFGNGFVAFFDLQTRGVRYRFLGYDNDLNNVSQSADLTFFNPKFGLTYSFSNKWSIYGFWGAGNREPNRDDYTQSTPDHRPRPERLYDLEAGIRAAGREWRFSANFFHMSYRDQLVLDGRLNEVGAYIRTNVPKSRRVGLEIETSVRPGPRLTIGGNVALSDNTIREFTEFRDNWDTGGQETFVHRNTDLAFSPDVIARAEVDYILVKNTTHTFSATLSGKYVGSQFLDNTSNEQTALPAYLFSDLRLNYNLHGVFGKEVALIFAINNLFGARYSSNGWVYRFISETYDPRAGDPYSRRESAGVYHQAGFFPQAGRNWMATARIRF
ncbi:MAG: TonB-dependent receptor [Lewinellaceae bacterium]|nr:TonB-dependent receptor [Lewinellaceae bacterium]